MQGCGRQATGLVVNFAGQFAVALPVALICAFVLKLGVVGLYLGLIAGVAVQAAAYTWVFLGMDWQGLADSASHDAQLDSKAGQSLESSEIIA